MSTVYRVLGTEQNEVMKDVARIEGEGAGFWASDLFGERTFIQGTIKSVDFMSGEMIIDSSDSG